ncbi:hypothetical protein JRQ81_011302 [Phrynocephalus forsythii]|uniref:Uncharacterized protein n=1 Tax=Phrynocephalus forsythii TaxID=171643 RepID=A0A9Q0Y3W1_9SAUR|nr:hypothetical protein JRQ81_011302 [Phrynocephalus forsythii]
MLAPSRGVGKARRRRHDLLLGQLGVLASLLSLVLLAGALAGQRGGRPDALAAAAVYDVLNSALETSDKWIGRRLLQEAEENVTDNPEETRHLYLKNCTEPELPGKYGCFENSGNAMKVPQLLA